MATADTSPDSSDTPLGTGVEVAPGVIMPGAALVFSASRASGPGGQNVNKVNSRVELRVAIRDIPITPGARSRLRRLGGRRVTAEGELIIAAEDQRSQRRNKDSALERLRELIGQAMVKPKPRIATKPTKASQRRRVDAKTRKGKIKKKRGGSRGEGDFE